MSVKELERYLKPVSGSAMEMNQGYLTVIVTRLMDHVITEEMLVFTALVCDSWMEWELGSVLIIFV